MERVRSPSKTGRRPGDYSLNFGEQRLGNFSTNSFLIKCSQDVFLKIERYFASRKYLIYRLLVFFSTEMLFYYILVLLFNRFLFATFFVQNIFVVFTDES